MLTFIQFPLTDIRAFSPQETGLLPYPTWPIPTPYRDFIRSFGTVRVRSRGGLRGWGGENEICSADAALKFIGPLGYRRSKQENNSTKGEIGLKCSSRHFYHDGSGTSKYEVLLSTRPSRVSLSTAHFMELLNHILHLPVLIKIPKKQVDHLALIRAGKHLAQLYLFSSTYVDKHQNIQEDWVQPGSPMLFLELGSNEQVRLPYASMVEQYEREGFHLHQWWFKESQGTRIAAWILRYDEDAEKETFALGRTLRLYLMRLHADLECLKNVLRMATTDMIEMKPDTAQGQHFQFYLNELTGRINRNTLKAREIAGTEAVSDMAVQAWETFSPGQREAFLSQLEQYKVRPQIYRKVRDISIYTREVTMGDKYQADQVFSQGPAKFDIDKMEVHQSYDARQQEVQLLQLAAELAFVREKMAEDARTPQQYVVIGEVAAAEMAAQEGNFEKVKEHLQKAGKWALDTATSIGTKVAAELMVQAIKPGP